MKISSRCQSQNYQRSYQCLGNKLLSVTIVGILFCSGLTGILLLCGTSNAAPVIFEEDDYGYWYDNFTDTVGIEMWDNLLMTGNDVALDSYPILYDDFTGTNGDPPDTGKWTLLDDGWDLDIQSNTLHSYANPPSPTWAYEMVENKDPLSIPHNLTWRQQVHTVGSGMYVHFFIIKASDNSFLLNFDQNNAGQYNIYNYISPGSVLLGMSISGWHDYKVTYDNGYVEVYYDGVKKHSYDFGAIPIKYRFGTYMQLTSSTIYTDDVSITSNYTIGNMTSTEIVLPGGQSWDSLIINKSEFGPENVINVTILDGATYQPIPGYENITGTDIDISGIDIVTYPTTRLRAHFYSDGNPSPVLHSWNATWTDTAPPITPTGFKVNNPFNGYSLVLSWNPNQEPDIEYYLLYYSLDNITFFRLTNLDNNTNFYTHYGLEKGTTYYYKIAAGDEVPNQSPFSEVVEGVPDLDYDGDGIGDIPDPDDDNDGIPDFSDTYPLSDVNDMESKIDDILSMLNSMNLSTLRDILEYLNQSLPTIGNLSAQLSGMNDSLLARILDAENNILSELADVNATLYTEIQNLLTDITNDLADIMAALIWLETNLSAQHDSINNTIDLLSILVNNEHTMTRNEILTALNNSLALLQILDGNMTSHDGDIKALLDALNALINNENNLTRNQLAANITQILDQLQIVDQGILDEIAEVMASLGMLEANLTAHLNTLDTAISQLSDMVGNEHALTRSQILDNLNNTLALLQTLDGNITTHDTEIKNLLTALDSLIQNENDMTRDQLIDNATEILNQLQLVNQGILDDIADLDVSVSDQLVSLLDNITTNSDALKDWLSLVLGLMDANLIATNETLHSHLDDLNTLITTFYDDMVLDLDDILSELQLLDLATGQNHTEQITYLQGLLDGQIEKEKIDELKSKLVDLAGNISDHNQSLADSILAVVDDIDTFEVQTNRILENINNTLNELAKLDGIINDLDSLDQSLGALDTNLQDSTDDLQDSIEDKSKEEEIEERVAFVETLLYLALILLFVNLVLTVVMGLRKKPETGTSVPESEVEQDYEKSKPRPPKSNQEQVKEDDFQDDTD